MPDPMMAAPAAEAAEPGEAADAAEICVKIEAYADGRVMVGVVPPEVEQNGPPQGQPEEQSELDYMKPAKSIDDALQIARGLLSQGKPNANAEQDFQAGFNKGAPSPATTVRKIPMGSM